MFEPKSAGHSAILKLAQEMIEAAKAGDSVRLEAARAAYKVAQRLERPRVSTFH